MKEITPLLDVGFPQENDHFSFTFTKGEMSSNRTEEFIEIMRHSKLKININCKYLNYYKNPCLVCVNQWQRKEE